MTLRLRGSTSGYAEINAPAVAGDNSLTLPTTAGTIRITNPSGVDGDYTVATGATISGSTNTITASTNGEDRLHIDSAGRMGLGTVNPTRTLDISGSGGSSIRIIDSTSYAELSLNGAGTENYIESDDSLVYNVGGGEKMRILSSGNIGIGTDNPDRKLHVGESFIRVDDGYGLDSSGSTEKVVLDNGFISLTTNSTERLRIISGGNVGIGSTIPASNLDVTGNISVSSIIDPGSNTTGAASLIAAQDLVESASAFNLTGGALTIRSGYVNKTTNNGYGSSRTFVGGDLTLAAGRGESLDASATKTDGNIYLGHQGASGFEQKMRIDSNGDIRFDGNIGIHASDVYYTNTYEMDSSWTSYQTVTSSLAANAVYLVSINWVHGSSANQPYYYSTSFLWTTCNGTNGTGTDNEKTFLHSTHTGVTSYFMTFRGIATTGSNNKLQLKVNSAWPGINSGNVLNITLNQIMFGTRI